MDSSDEHFKKITGLDVQGVPTDQLENMVRMFRVAAMHASAELVYGPERARGSFGERLRYDMEASMNHGTER